MHQNYNPSCNLSRDEGDEERSKPEVGQSLSGPLAAVEEAHGREHVYPSKHHAPCPLSTRNGNRQEPVSSRGRGGERRPRRAREASCMGGRIRAAEFARARSRGTSSPRTWAAECREVIRLKGRCAPVKSRWCCEPGRRVMEVTGSDQGERRRGGRPSPSSGEKVN